MLASVSPPHTTQDTSREAFEAAWKHWTPGSPPPRWQDFLPPAGKAVPADFGFALVQTDIEFRVKAGLPALLAEPYFAQPRLQAADAGVDAARQVDLVRWEYQLRWQHGQRTARQDYVERFPEHAAALRELRPLWRCPDCKRAAIALADEAAATAACPGCGKSHPVSTLFPHAAWPRTSDTFDSYATVPPAPRPAAGPGGPTVPGDGPRAGRYLLGEELGAGGMGEVFRAHDPDLNRSLAVKILKQEHAGQAELERRFLEEAQVTGQLQHPGVPPIHELGRLPDGRPFFAMKLIKGRTLADLLKERKSPADELPRWLAVFAQVCQAVGYAHSKRVIHRDLKPGNVMVGAFGEVQVMDWGLAKVLTDRPANEEAATAEASVVATTRRRGAAEGTRGALGTPAFMPPEQAGGEVGRVDERTDVFGLGGILCVILTGQPPYTGRSAEAVFFQAVGAELAPARQRLKGSGADPQLLELARQCLAAEPGERPRDGGVVAERVRAYLASVQERLRTAEVDQAAAQARAEEAETKKAFLAGAWAAAQARAEEAAAKAAAGRRARSLLLVLAAAVFIASCGLTAWIVIRQQSQSLQQEALTRSQTVLSFGQASRDYADNNTLSPAVQRRLHVGLILEADANFVARGTFDALEKYTPGYMYRLASLNPLNDANRADHYEGGLIEQFRAPDASAELSGFRGTGDDERFYVARPIVVRAACLACHGSPATAPPELVKRYGSSSGYGWRVGEVNSAIIVTVPTADIRADQRAVTWTVIGIFGALALVLIGLVYVLFEFVVHRRLIRSTSGPRRDQTQLEGAGAATLAGSGSD
jgi:hypothetical protein